MAVLNVNIDHVATIRQARRADEPDPAWAAVECELAGANGITVHLRQDRRHINDRDVRVLKETVACKLNLEMSMAEPIVKIAEQVVPDQVTLVPENRAELTTEGGLGLRPVQAAAGRGGQTDAQERHRGQRIHHGRPGPDRRLGRDRLRRHRAAHRHVCQRQNEKAAQRQVLELMAGRDFALENGLIVHAGHGLTYRNIGPVARIEGLCEFNIGHSIVSRAVLVGMRQATREMIELIDKYGPRRTVKRKRVAAVLSTRSRPTQTLK